MADTQMIEQLEAERSMFVQTALSTLYFSDRPQRVVGHLATNDFVDLWDEGDNSFEEDPPNAVLAFREPGDDAPEDAVVVIEGLGLENGQLSYSIQTLEGAVPGQAGPGHAVHRSVRAAAVPGLSVWCAPARAPTRPQKALIDRRRECPRSITRRSS
jgi:hypothetical protein